MREIRTPGSMSGEEKRSDGLLGETSNERRWPLSPPPVLYATALLLDSTTCIRNLSYRLRFSRRIDPDLGRQHSHRLIVDGFSTWRSRRIIGTES